MAKRMIILEYDDNSISFQKRQSNRRTGVYLEVNGIEFNAFIVVPFIEGDKAENQHKVDLIKEVLDEYSVPAPERGENG